MHDIPMTLDDFETRLDRHGADLGRWPADVRTQGEQLLATSVGARKLLAEARDIAELLDEALPAATLTTSALRSRILDEVAREAARPRVLAWLLGGSRTLRPVAIAAALIPLSLGFAIGIGYQPGRVTEDLASDVSLLAFADYETYTDAK